MARLTVYTCTNWLSFGLNIHILEITFWYEGNKFNSLCTYYQNQKSYCSAYKIILQDNFFMSLALSPFE